MSLLEFLDRTSQHVSRKFFEKYKDEKHGYSEWEALIENESRKHFRWR